MGLGEGRVRGLTLPAWATISNWVDTAGIYPPPWLYRPLRVNTGRRMAPHDHDSRPVVIRHSANRKWPLCSIQALFRGQRHGLCPLPPPSNTQKINLSRLIWHPHWPSGPFFTPIWRLIWSLLAVRPSHKRLAARGFFARISINKQRAAGRAARTLSPTCPPGNISSLILTACLIFRTSARRPGRLALMTTSDRPVFSLAGFPWREMT